MAGLVPAIPLKQAWLMAEYFVYFLASRPGGAIYVGVTNDLIRRVYEHKTGAVKGHTKRFKIDNLVYFESYGDVRDALQREQNIKHWPRAWKTNLIVVGNPSWRDLYEEIAGATAWPPKRDHRDKPGDDKWMDCQVIGERSDAVLRTAMPGNDASRTHPALR